jgi:hypothetical protein
LILKINQLFLSFIKFYLKMKSEHILSLFQPTTPEHVADENKNEDRERRTQPAQRLLLHQMAEWRKTPFDNHSSAARGTIATLLACRYLRPEVRGSIEIEKTPFQVKARAARAGASSADKRQNGKQKRSPFQTSKMTQ